MTDHPNAEIWRKWLALWNGDLMIAPDIIAADFQLHMAPIGGGGLEQFAGPEGLAGWVAMLHAAIKPFRFSVQVEPLYDRDMIAGRWIAEGRYAGGFPGATAEPGALVRFAGADFLRIENGLIAEYWLSSDSLELIQQLGVKS